MEGRPLRAFSACSPWCHGDGRAGARDPHRARRRGEVPHREHRRGGRPALLSRGQASLRDPAPERGAGTGPRRSAAAKQLVPQASDVMAPVRPTSVAVTLEHAARPNWLVNFGPSGRTSFSRALRISPVRISWRRWDSWLAAVTALSSVSVVASLAATSSLDSANKPPRACEQLRGRTPECEAHARCSKVSVGSAAAHSPCRS